MKKVFHSQLQTTSRYVYNAEGSSNLFSDLPLQPVPHSDKVQNPEEPLTQADLKINQPDLLIETGAIAPEVATEADLKARINKIESLITALRECENAEKHNLDSYRKLTLSPLVIEARSIGALTLRTEQNLLTTRLKSMDVIEDSM
jgi:hypothetical protein